MASNESNNSNTFETGSVRMEVSELSNMTVLPIPENTPSANTSTKILLCITNNTSVPLLYYPCRSIIPKLIKLNEEMMPIGTPIFGIRVNVDYQQKLVNKLSIFISNIVKRLKRQNIKNPDYYLISPKEDLLIDVNTKFLWQNNLLYCQISSDEYYSNNHPNYYNYWLLNEITPGFYKLEFSYCNINGVMKAKFDSGMREVITIEELSSCELATSSTNLHLVQTASHDNKAIEANGVQFKIEMPKPILNVPFLLPGAKTSIKLGIRATNNTSIPLCFQRISSMFPILKGDNGKIIEPDCDIVRLWVSEGPNYYEAMPGASTFFVLDSKLYRNFLNQLQLAIPNEAGGFWYFRNLKLGKYQLHFMYEVVRAPTTLYQPEDSVSENLWTGCVVMPPIEFRIVR